ncbi:MAG: diguanylate cyclase [Bacteroidetes bacterium]|nr:diguanylate cyclase [Bacteroidota bacterium]
MRKIVLFIGFILLAVSVFGIVFNFGLSFFNAKSVEKGIIDFSENSYASISPTILKGDWEIYPDQLTDSEQWKSETEPLYTQVPSSWTTLSVNNEGEKLKSFGFAAYRVQLLLPESGYYSIAIDTVYTAYEMYVNGILVAEVGNFGTDQESHYPRFTDRIVTFYCPEPQADIVFNISNFTHPFSGFGKAPIFGLPHEINRIMITTYSTSLFLIGILCMNALFMLFFYSKNNQDKSILYFSALCILISLRTITTNTVLTFYLPNIPTSLQLKLEYLSITLTFIAAILYIKHAFPHLLHHIVEKALLGISLAYSLAIIILPVRIYNLALIYFFIMLALAAVYWLIAMFISWFKKEQASGIILFGGFILTLAVINDIIYYLSGTTNLFAAELSAFGLTFFIITHSNEFSYKFLQALIIASETTKDLENKVTARTRQLSELNSKLLVMATKDELTDLWNRNELQQRSEKETAKYNRYYTTNSTYFSVQYLDLDNFKYYNDTFSHEAGDRILKIFAKVLLGLCRKSDTIFRMGGDEFVIFLPKTNTASAAQLSQRILDILDSFNDSVAAELSSIVKHQVVISRERQLTCSIGIAVHENGFINIDRLIQYADTALLRAKEQGKNCFIIHSGHSLSTIKKIHPIQNQ